MANIAAGFIPPAPEQWTPADEMRFLDMQDRRKRVLEARRAPVIELSILLAREISDTSFDTMADWLIHRADEIRDILAPFDSGVRPSKEG